MSEANAHPPGSFCWVELGTSDQEAAKKFYNTIFGWSASDSPIGPGQLYTEFALDDATVAAAFTQVDAPPNWALYVTVANVDETAAHVKPLGGKLRHAPFDVMDLGRMAALTDPTGASLVLWEPLTHSGFEAESEENTFCWADLNTPDPARAKAFYEALLGWTIEATPNDPSGYLHIQNGDDFIGGIPPAHNRAGGTPAHWLVYFQTADCDGCTAKAEEHGARIHTPPMSLPRTGRISVLSDPQGAVFALFEPQTAA